MTILAVRTVPKPWGRADLPPPFAQERAEPVGEIWFQPPDDLGALLVKYIFTSEKLSVQCHPSDDQARAMGLGAHGKEECWYIIDAEPDARIAIGFTGTISAEELRTAALDGTIQGLLAWHKVSAGDFFYIPAGTVHAIGAGVSLIEVQQNADITFRLYDYGRPRALHLDAAASVADRGPYPAHLHRSVPHDSHAELVAGPFFMLDHIHGPPDAGLLTRYDAAALLLPLAGSVTLADGQCLESGQCARIDRLADVTFAADARCLIARPRNEAHDRG